MASCLNCKYCNKESTSFMCVRLNKVVSPNEWCHYYFYPFSDKPQETQPILKSHYQPLHNPLERKLIEFNKISTKAVYKPYLNQNGYVAYYKS